MILLRPVRFDLHPVRQGQFIPTQRSKIEIGQLGVRHCSFPLNVEIQLQSNNVSSIGTLGAKTYAFLDAFGFVAEIVDAVPVDQQARCFDLHEVAHYVSRPGKAKSR